ncbi:WD40-repeat-containing domain protein [Phyllosticta citricarpa]|uniref:WD40-repeat-containing domain protein n=2 Tax=Phyllosticta TaxID=121621 RepID=A0ABR1LHE3_9PEZI
MDALSANPSNAEADPGREDVIAERAQDEDDERPSSKEEENPRHEFTASTNSNWQLHLRSSYDAAKTRLIAAAIPYGSSSTSQPHVQKSLAWSPDGSCLITHSFDNTLRTFTVLNNLADDMMAEPTIAPYSTLETADNITSFAVSPFFSIADPSTTCVFHSTYDQPVQCRNVFEPSKVLAAYPLFNPQTEEPMRVYCMAFSRDGQHLLCGSQAHIATFDLTRPGAEPVSLFKTSPGRKAQRRHELADLRGKVSSMSMSPDGLLAAGTFARNIGIFADDGAGECVTSFSLASRSERVGGTDAGVSMLRWCPSGSYLYAAELNSDRIHMYDIRHTGRCLGALVGRRGNSSQRIDFDIAPRTDGIGDWDGYNVVSGGTDGVVRVWEKPHEKGDQIEHTYEWQAHEETVCGIAVNPWYPMLATSAGHWRWSLEEDYESDDDDASDSSESSSDSDGSESGTSCSEAASSSRTLSEQNNERSNQGAAAGWMKIWEA